MFFQSFSFYGFFFSQRSNKRFVCWARMSVQLVLRHRKNKQQCLPNDSEGCVKQRVVNDGSVVMWEMRGAVFVIATGPNPALENLIKRQ